MRVPANVRRAINRLRPVAAQLSHDEAQRYWRDPPDEGNRPDAYAAEGGGRSRHLADLLAAHVEPTSSVLEVGCNVGRNLHFLHDAGFEDLTGVEINASAVEQMRPRFPELADVVVHVGPAEEELPELDPFDVVFTMAVLEL